MKILKIFAVGLIVLAVFFTFLLIPRKININKINCISSDGNCSEEILGKLSGLEGKSYYEVKKRTLSILKNDSNISQYHLEYRPLSSLNVFVAEKKPKFTITKMNPQEKVYVDKDGSVMQISNNLILPNLIFEGELPQPGAKLSAKEFFAINLLNSLNQTFQINEARFTGDSLLIELPTQIRVIFPVEGDRETLIGSLVLIQNELTSGAEGKNKDIKANIKSIDLRYKNPILKTDLN